MPTKKAMHYDTQIYCNLLCEDAYDQLKKYIAEKRPIKTERLYTCSAEIIYYPEYTVLKSYNTIVAFIGLNHVLYDVLRLVYGYTSTSCQHIAKFRNYMLLEYIRHNNPLCDIWYCYRWEVIK